MKLYLLRHGDALEMPDDAKRPLSQQGQQEILAISSFLKKNGVKITKIYHSGKLRAEQTAEIMQTGLGGLLSNEFLKGLQPDEEVKPIAAYCDHCEGDTLLVSHLPFLARLAGSLVLGQENSHYFDFQTGSLLCLESVRGYWRISWFIFPKLVMSSSDR